MQLLFYCKSNNIKYNFILFLQCHIQSAVSEKYESALFMRFVAKVTDRKRLVELQNDSSIGGGNLCTLQ